MSFKKIIILFTLLSTFSLVYNVTFYIKDNGVEIKYCAFGDKGNIIRFSLNNKTYTLKVDPPKVNVSRKAKEIFEKMIRDRNMNELRYFDERLMRYDEFLKLRKEISYLKELYKNGSFCKKLEISEKVSSFEGVTRGNYVIIGNFIVEEPCTKVYRKNNTLICVVEGTVHLKRRSEKNKNVVLFLVVWSIAFASMLIGLKKR